METEKLINTVLALIFVVALMGLLALIAKRMGLSQGGKATGKRLKILESLSLDGKRRAVILQCDQKQHLVILSHNGETVVDSEIPAPIETEVRDEKPFE